MASSSIAAELQQLQQYETYEPIVRRLGVSAAALYVWDFTLTFHHEVSILWGTKWTKSRTLFFINRYFGLGAIIASAFFNVETNPTISMSRMVELRHYRCSSGFEHRKFVISCFRTTELTLSSIVILLRRLFVLYDHRRVIVIPMVVLFFVVFISMMGIAIALSVYSQANSFVILGICAGPTPSWFLPFWMPLMAFDFLIMGLAGFKSVQHYRRVPNKKWSGAQLMKTLARDSFIYFACSSN
ncbi:uncharacterized protein EDB91DRAFT_497519 [Suillus paluster]|uniref:uncharacterized protein n=1 Tax=Suillus paluster TaxID=48578 RepID=UPI001B87B947|nr:uncharacterized protein EDB91DRAFT_497519 [Suillus paluster]KAG1736931.1 hypothetical protein EDB91DRAFT_497519 [Suillus paluster]